jgi:hypothetical protein
MEHGHYGQHPLPAPSAALVSPLAEKENHHAAIQVRAALPGNRPRFYERVAQAVAAINIAAGVAA